MEPEVASRIAGGLPGERKLDLLQRLQDEEARARFLGKRYDRYLLEVVRARLEGRRFNRRAVLAA